MPRLPFLLAVAWGGVVTSVAAQSSGTEEPGSWMLAFGAQVDEDESEAVLTSVDWRVASKTWLSLGLGRTSSPADRAAVEADTVSIAIDQRFDAVGFTLSAARWGDSGVLETDDLGASIYVARAAWRLAFGYETRDIEIPFTITGPFGGTLQRSVTLGADSYSLDVRTGLGEHWTLYAHIADHDYERDLRVLPRIDRLNFLSASTFTLANSFSDSERSLALEREFPRSVFSVRAATDRSAIDGTRFETLDAALLFPIAGRLDLEVSVGSGRSDLFGSGFFGGLLFFVYGR